MGNIIKKVPMPACGVMLGTAVLGNLLQSYSEGIRYACGIAAAFVLILVLLKLFMFPQAVKEDMNNPIMASVSGTFPMAIMVLSTYAKPFLGSVAFVLWLVGLVLHIALIIFFSLKFVLKLDLKKVFASYYIVYVGLGTAAITAPAFEKHSIGAAAFWFGFVSLIILLMLVTIRYLKYKEIPEPAKPLVCIYAAPTSLCVAGYVQSVMPKSKTFLLAMFAVATVLYIFSVIKAIGFLKLPFYPSYASFTFPFAVSGVAAKQTMACLANMESPIPALKYVVLIETIIAVLFVVYTYCRYMGFIFGGEKSK